MEELLVRSLKLLLVAAGIPLATASLAGLTVAVLQAATQVQDQCIGFAVRLISVFLSLTILWRWICSYAPDLFVLAFRSITAVGVAR